MVSKQSISDSCQKSISQGSNTKINLHYSVSYCSSGFGGVFLSFASLMLAEHNNRKHLVPFKGVALITYKSMIPVLLKVFIHSMPSKLTT